MDALYDAAGNVALLPAAVERVTNCLRAQRALLQVRPGAYDAPPIFVEPHRFDSCMLALIGQQHYWQKDFWARGGVRLNLGAGQTFVGEECVDDATLWSSEIFSDVLAPLEIPRVLVGVADRNPDEILHMTVFRDDRSGPFDDHERKTMTALLPAIKVATRSAFQIWRHRAVSESVEVILDYLDDAIILVNSYGQVLDMNSAGERLLARHDELRVSQVRLATCCDQDAPRLAAMLHAVTTPGEAPQPVVVHDEFGRPALVLTAVPLRRAAQVRRDARQAGLPVAAIFVTPTGMPSPAPARCLAAVYGLTPAEARLAERLAAGASLSEIAEAQAITRETVRSQLKAVYCKTDTHRQSELVALVLSLGSHPMR